jgi:hypothetical protein
MADGISSQPLLRNGIEAINRALAWWLSGLRATAESLFRFAQKPVLEFVVEGDAGPRPASNSAAPIKGSRRDIRLQLAENAFHYRKIKLPQSAHRNVDRVIHYEFGKYFPMNAADVLYSCTVVPPAKGATSIEIEIWAIARSTVDAYVTMMRHEYNLVFGKLMLVDSSGRDLIIHDIEKEQRLSAGAETRRARRMLNLLIVALLAGMAVYPVTRIDVLIAQQEREIEGLEKRAQPVIELRENIMALENRFYDLVSRKNKNSSGAYTWSHLTGSLADRAILDRMVVNDHDVQVSGKARSVEALLRELEADPLITEVKVVGAIRASKDPRFEVLNLLLKLEE